MENTQTLIQEAARLGALNALSDLGLSTGEISRTEAFRRFGRPYITKLAADGRLKPSRIGNGKSGTIRYAVADILAIRAADKLQAATL